MSVLDDLRRFGQEWDRHQRWRQGNKYVSEERGVLTLHLRELPEALQRTLKENIELVIGGAVDAHYVDELERLKKLTIEEAERVLLELKR